MSSIWILIIHYKNFSITKACLESVLKQVNINYQILVVNNNDLDFNSKDLLSLDANIHTLNLDDNYGYAGGANKGIEYCKDRGGLYVYLLNNDIILETTSLLNLYEASQKFPQAALLSLATVDNFADNSLKGIGQLNFIKAKSYLKPVYLNKDYIECQWLSGSNLFFNLENFTDNTFFDERYFLYFEDTELGYRKFKQGYKCLLITSSKVIHKNGQSFGNDINYLRSYYYMRNRALFFSENQSNPILLSLNYLYILGHVVKEICLSPIKRRPGKLKAELKGLQDFLYKKLGKHI